MTNIMEIWKPVVGYENLYEISSLGSLRTIKTGKIHRQFDRCGNTKNRGYRDVCLSNGETKRNFKVHSVVMRAFAGERPIGFVINHIDGNKANNSFENLEYCTQSENRKKDFITGRQSLKGEKNNQSKLTQDDVLNIYNEYKSGLKISHLALKYNVSYSCINQITTNRTWRNVIKI